MMDISQTKEYINLPIWFVIISPLITAFLSAYISHFFNKKRDSDLELKKIKLSVFSELISRISSEGFMDEISIFMEKIKEELNNEEWCLKNKDIDIKKEVVRRLARHMGEYLGPARILAGVELDSALREYFSLTIRIIESREEDKNQVLLDKRQEVIFSIEKLIKKDLLK